MRPRYRSLLALVLAVFGGLLSLSARGALSSAAPPEPTPEVTAALKEGQEAETAGKRDEAAALYRRALHLAQESKDRPGEAAALNRLAGGLIYQKPLDALEYLRQAEVILRDLGDQPGLARCLLNLGNACQISSQPDQALRYYDACGTLAEEIGDRSLQASALANSGTVFIRTGRPHEALRRLLTALPIQEASGRRDTVLRTLGNLGAAYRNASDLPRALEVLERARPLARELKLKGDEGIILLNLGLTHLTVTGPEKAIECYHEGLALLSDGGDQRTVAALYTSMAAARQLQGELFQALAAAQKALDLQREIGDKNGIARSQAIIAALYQGVGQLPMALQVYTEALPVARAAQDRLAETMILTNVGRLQLRLGQREDARKSFEQALTVHKEQNYPDARADALLQLSRLAQAEEKNAEALALGEEALGLMRTAGTPAGQGRAEFIIAGCYEALGRFADARVHYETALKLLAESGHSDGEATAATRLATLEEKQGRPREAERWFTRALELLERQRASLQGLSEAKVSYLEQELPAYRDYIRFLLKRGRTAQAFDWAQRAKGRALVDLMQAGNADISRAMSEADRARERDLERKEKLLSLKERAALSTLQAAEARAQPGRASADAARAQVADLRKQQQQVERERRAFQDALYARNPLLAQQRAARVLNLAEAVKLVPADTALLEFMVLTGAEGSKAPDEIVLFVATDQSVRAGPKVFRTSVPSGRLAKLARDFREACSGRPGSGAARPYQALARELYRLAVGPATAALAGKRRLILCPDGPLWDVPFQALLVPADKAKQGAFLWERFELVYSYSATGAGAAVDAARKAGATPAKGSLLVLANPSLASMPAAASREVPKADPVHHYMRTATLGALPSTLVEARRIKAAFPNALVKTAGDAQESLVKELAPKYRRVHFATHALFNDAAPLLGGVVLAQPPAGSTEDGILTARELLTLPLGAEMVVLSACNTARGATRSGEGMVGLTWALFVAGVPTQVVSQWSVDDAATARLMGGFYQNLRAGKPRDTALRASALALLRDPKHRHPFYWAPFLMMGAWR